MHGGPGGNASRRWKWPEVFSPSGHFMELQYTPAVKGYFMYFDSTKTSSKTA
jgi:hypothetical protein